MKRRVIMKIDVFPESKAVVDHYADFHGMIHSAVYSKLVLWIVQQDDALKAGVMANDPDVAKAILKKMAAAAKK